MSLCAWQYLQVGGQCTDFIIVLRTSEAVKMFGGNMHISFGAGMSAAAGVVGRSAEADIRAGDGGVAACYTYSSSKGTFLRIFSQSIDILIASLLISKCL